MPEIKNILCPVDFSETSDYALEYALDLARQLGASVTLLHVCQLPAHPMDAGDMFPLEEFENEYMTRFSKQLDELVARHAGKGVELDSRITCGIPYDEINQAADEVSADLVVIGTHGRTGLAHMLLGSVAERVVRTSRVPVLTLRKP